MNQETQEQYFKVLYYALIKMINYPFHRFIRCILFALPVAIALSACASVPLKEAPRFASIAQDYCLVKVRNSYLIAPIGTIEAFQLNRECHVLPMIAID